MKKSMFGSAVVAAVALLAGVAQADTVKNSNTGSEQFIDAASVWENGLAPSEDNDYVISQSQLNARSGVHNFGGNSLTVSGGDLWLLGNEGELVMTNEVTTSCDLIFKGGKNLRHRNTDKVNGYWIFSGDGYFRVDGNFYLQNCKDQPYGWDCRMQMKLKTDTDYATGVDTRHVYFSDGKMKGFTRLCIENDASEFKGIIHVCSCVNSSVAIAQTFNGRIDVDVTGGAVEQIGAAAYAKEVYGTESLGNGFAIKMNTNGCFTIDRLGCYGGTVKYVPYGTGWGRTAPGYLKLDDDVNLHGGTLALDVCPQALMTKAETVTVGCVTLTNVVKLVEYTGSQTDFVKNFTLVATNSIPFGVIGSYEPAPGAVTLTNATDGTTQIIYAQVENRLGTIVEHKQTDGSTSGGSSLTLTQDEAFYKQKWSDGQKQHAGAHYIIGSENYFAKKTGADQLMVGSAGVEGSQHFLGDSLYCTPYAKIAICGMSFYVTNMTMVGGAQIFSYGGIDGSVFKGTPIAFVKDATNPSKPIHVELPGNNGVTLNAGIEGDCDIELISTGQGNVVRLMTDNPDYTGKIQLGPTKTAQARVTLKIGSALSLGDSLDAFAADSLLLYSNQVLHVVNTTTFEDATRGWTIRSKDGKYAAIQANGGVTATVKVPIAFNGELRKNGEGTLALGGSITFEADDDSVAGTPIEGRNKLTIETGNLAVLTTNAVDGLAITFKNNCGLVIDASTDEMKRYGLYNTKWSVPLVKEESGKLAVSFTNATLASDAKLAICTVPTAGKTLRVDSFDVAKQPGLHITVTEEADETSGTTTFYANFQSAGLMLFVR